MFFDLGPPWKFCSKEIMTNFLLQNFCWDITQSLILSDHDDFFRMWGWKGGGSNNTALFSLTVKFPIYKCYKSRVLTFFPIHKLENNDMPGNKKSVEYC